MVSSRSTSQSDCSGARNTNIAAGFGRLDPIALASAIFPRPCLSHRTLLVSDVLPTMARVGRDLWRAIDVVARRRRCLSPTPLLFAVLVSVLPTATALSSAWFTARILFKLRSLVGSNCPTDCVSSRRSPEGTLVVLVCWSDGAIVINGSVTSGVLLYPISPKTTKTSVAGVFEVVLQTGRFLCRGTKPVKWLHWWHPALPPWLWKHKVRKLLNLCFKSQSHMKTILHGLD